MTLSIGGMTCSSCTNAVTLALLELPGAADVNVNLLGNAATLTVPVDQDTSAIVSAIEDIGYSAEVVAVEALSPGQSTNQESTPHQGGGPLHVELSVDGMTCAACVNNVTGLLAGIPGVSDVTVNLMGKSATAVVQDRKLIAQLEEVVNDAGYEAEVVNVRSVDTPAELHSAGPRTVTLRVDGMFCS